MVLKLARAALSFTQKTADGIVGFGHPFPLSEQTSYGKKI